MFTFFPDGSVLVTYTNEEGPITNSSIIDASKLGELAVCLHFLFTFLFTFFQYVEKRKPLPEDSGRSSSMTLSRGSPSNLAGKKNLL